MMNFDAIAFDADDTLWHNMNHFTSSQQTFREILLPYHSAEWIDERLYETERRNLAYYGYGVKGFMLSMIETAIELTEGRISGREIQTILDVGTDMLKEPVQLLDHVAETIHELSHGHKLMLITKGDLFDQERKIAGSGLADYFAHVEIVSEKDEQTYGALFEKYSLAPEHILMIGNSVRSDILPIVNLGGQSVHIPYRVTWEHEMIDENERAEHSYHELDSIAQLPALIKTLCTTTL